VLEDRERLPHAGPDNAATNWEKLLNERHHGFSTGIEERCFLPQARVSFSLLDRQQCGLRVGQKVNTWFLDASTRCYSRDQRKFPDENRQKGWRRGRRLQGLEFFLNQFDWVLSHDLGDS
jgi:hypothetical protein